MNKVEGKELGVSIIKSLLGAVPYAGNLLGEVLFDYRSRIKQERLNNFIGLLAIYFADNPNIDLVNIKSENFGDLFESIIKRVVLTKSNEKHKRFKDILVYQIEHPDNELDSSEIYLDLIYTLSELAIKILNEHYVFRKAYLPIDASRSAVSVHRDSIQGKINECHSMSIHTGKEYEKLQQDFTIAQKKFEEYNAQVQELQRFRSPDFFGFTDDLYLYYKQILMAKGLLIDEGSIGHGTGLYKYPQITEFGMCFMEFMIQ
jgi:hypothetical protein